MKNRKSEVCQIRDGLVSIIEITGGVGSIYFKRGEITVYTAFSRPDLDNPEVSRRINELVQSGWTVAIGDKKTAYSRSHNFD